MSAAIAGLIEAARIGSSDLAPMAGGMSHDVYVAGDVVLKVFRSNDDGEAEREHALLRALAGSAAGPTLLAYDEGPPPVIAMTRVAGSPIGAALLTMDHVGPILAAAEAVHALPLGTLQAASHPVPLAARAISMLDRVRPTDDSNAAVALARRWLPTRSIALQPVMARGDWNTTNLLWDQGALALIDFEDAGVSDAAFEAADLAEHAAWRAAPAAVVGAIIEGMAPGRARAVLESRRLMACFWLGVMLRRAERGDPPTQITAAEQAVRVLHLLA